MKLVFAASIAVFGMRSIFDSLTESEQEAGIDGSAIAVQQAGRMAEPPYPVVTTTTIFVPRSDLLLAISNELIAATNVYRATFGLVVLVGNAQLTLAAEAHSVEMATTLVMTHTGLNGSTPLQRATAAGYLGSYVGENLAVGFLTVASVLAAWIASPGHQANLVNPNFDQIGVAAAVGSDGRIYWTMDLGSSVL